MQRNLEATWDGKNEAGVTLVEVLVVVVIVMILSLIPLLSVQSSKTVFERQNFARELKSALERARFDSVKRRASDPGIQARVMIREDGFDLITFAKPQGAASSSTVLGEVLESKGIESDAGVFANSASDFTGAFPLTIYFNERGEISATDGSGQIISNPSIVICAGSCLNFDKSNSNILALSRTGTVNLLPGGSEVPTFVAPQISTVDSASGVNRLLVTQN
jgi:type II secretory pathway pseudopilin PulG